VLTIAVALLASAGSPAPAAAQTQPPIREIVIAGTQQRLAVPPCVPLGAEAGDPCATVTRVLRDDLEFQALFRFVDEDLYGLLSQPDPVAPDFEDWRSIFANFLVTTRARVQEGRLLLELRVFAVDLGGQILMRSYEHRLDEVRLAAHEAADDVMALTQYAGVARSRIVFASDRDDPEAVAGRLKELYIADYDGHNVRRFTVNRSLNILPASSPDGSRVAYVSYRSGDPEIYVAQVSLGRSLKLTQGGQSFAPSWSPDGSQVAYASNVSGNMEIWIAQADGSDARRITSSEAADTAPAWSPNGRELAFTSNRGGTPQIWLTDADGLNVRRLTGVGSYSDAATWSPSREHSEIAYTSRLEAGTFEIAVIDLGTRQVRQLTTGRGSCESPSWSPNGRHLVYSCNRGNRWELTVSDRLGRQLRTLSAGPGNNVHPDWAH
jgi:TolB protein